MKKGLQFILFMFLASNVVAGEAWYEFVGDISNIVDNTENSRVKKHYAQGIARYIVHVNSSKMGFWISNTGVIRPKNVYRNEELYTYYYYADYACGNALDLAYFGHEYFQLESRATYSGDRSAITVGHRLDIKSKAAFADWYVGMLANGKDSFKESTSKEAQSFAKSHLTLAKIHRSNPCRSLY